ncbi:MAG: manganese-dependent inorganic pyrophosphatase [Clostridiales bacterium]|nr:manganese-dependent inorganic pyrophosphatase [Clostridiales bacterium]
MKEERKNKVYVVGHKNPDTDSICSAIAYAYLKEKITGGLFQAMRAGEVNQETAFVLHYFEVKEPKLIKDVYTQVKDVEFRHIEGALSNISLKKAWERMRAEKANTLPVVNKSRGLEGLITISDIAKSYMEVYDNQIIGTARTPYRNVIETLEGELVVGNEHALITDGKVLVAAANPDLMESYIEKNDIVILGNRYESQLCAIEMEASCIIVCDGATVSYTITKLAEAKGCTIIKTPFDTFTASRLMNQSMPIHFFMKSKDLVSFNEDDRIEEIRDIMAKMRFRDFPILDDNGKFVGMISRRNFLDAKRKQIILVDHNERSQSVEGIEDAELLEIIDHHRLGGIQTMNPVFFRNQPLGCTATIVYQMYQENGIEIPKHIAGLLCSAILSDTLVYRSPTCTNADQQAAEVLSKIAGIDVNRYAKEMFAAGSNLRNKKEEEIFHQDYKVFTHGEILLGVGQINALDGDELEEMKDRLYEYMKRTLQEHKVSMLFFMLTNILEESTTLLFYGEGAKELVEHAFDHKNPEQGIKLERVVSRKKQLIPALMLALRQEN